MKFIESSKLKREQLEDCTILSTKKGGLCCEWYLNWRFLECVNQIAVRKLFWIQLRVLSAEPLDCLMFKRLSTCAGRLLVLAPSVAQLVENGPTQPVEDIKRKMRRKPTATLWRVAANWWVFPLFDLQITELYRDCMAFVNKTVPWVERFEMNMDETGL